MATSTITIISGASTVTLDNTVSTITLGTSGPQGAPGEGVPVGGTAGQILAKDSATDYDTSWIDNFTTDVRKYVKNDSGGTLAKGTVVYVSGANGANVLVKPAIATADGTSATTIGFLNESLANNGQGYAIVEGTISGIDTSAATAGDPVWLSGSVAGGVLYGVANKPQAPVHIVYLGTVTRAHANQGQIEISVNNGWELDELHNVKITSPANGQVLTYDSAQSLWVNSSETGDISAVNVTSPITGGGTSGAVTIGIDQTALAIAPSQVTGTAVITTDPRLSDARTPTAHASTHAAAGSDPVTLAQSQVTNLTTDLAGKAALASANAFTVGGHTITNTVAATIPLKITGAAGQSGAYFEVRDSANAIKMQVSSTGQGFFGGGTGNYATAPMMGVLNSTAAQIGLIIKGAASQTADMLQIQDSGGIVYFNVGQYGNIATNIGTTGGSYPGRLSVGTGTATTIGAVIRGSASQTANLQEWQSSAGSILARVDSVGNIYGNQVRTVSSLGLIGQENSGAYMTMVKQTTTASVPGTNGYAKLYFRDGTVPGTLKLVVRAGAAGAETTILDNIPQ